jgi:hypothetical protein
VTGNTSRLSTTLSIPDTPSSKTPEADTPPFVVAVTVKNLVPHPVTVLHWNSILVSMGVFRVFDEGEQGVHAAVVIAPSWEGCVDGPAGGEVRRERRLALFQLGGGKGV